MLADIAWGLYGFSRSYTSLLIVVFFAAMTLAMYGSLRLIIECLRAKPLELEPLDDAWWETVPRETRARIDEAQERIMTDIEFALLLDELDLRWPETEDTQ